MTSQDPIARVISDATGTPFRIAVRRAVGGGCINAGEVVSDQSGRHFFVKHNAASRIEMFEAEAAGLEEIAASCTVRVPLPVTWGVSGDQSFLVLEHLDLGHGSANGEALLGEQLASMHRHTSAQYGWDRDNTIGSTPQINTRNENWVAFFGRQRLARQLKLAADRGGHRLLESGEQLLADLPVFFSGYRPPPSLLHGDLWGGNHGFLTDRTPVIFDPAVYYGDREADMAMTELFGGFGADFYSAYRLAWPLDAGYSVRRELYNLYHVLNHFNLFGGGYARQAEQMIAQLLSETR